MNREYERFVIDCIERRQSFAIETTLRSHVTFEQARVAKAARFAIEMRYRGNLPRATDETDELWIYDNSNLGGPPGLVMEAKAGRIIFLEEPPPAWLARVFGWV